MRKIFFVIPALAGGGAERVILYIMRHIDRSKFRPHLILFERNGEFLTDIPSDISVKALMDNQSRYVSKYFVFISLAKLLKKERPDVVVSFMWYTNLVTVLARFLSKVKCSIIVSERTSMIPYENWFIKLLRNFTIRFLYPKATEIIVNSKSMGLILSKISTISANKIAIIHNPTDIRKINHMSVEDVNHPWYQENIPIIIAVGRLSLEKGFSYLIRAFRIIAAEGISCRLVILGEGAEKERLRKLVVELDIDDKVAFLGFQKNPYKYVANSTLFVLSSLYEGFPNVLLEALALGVPSVATRCPTGPEEIISDGVNGLLVPPADEKSLAEAIKRLLTDEALRKRLGEAGKKRAEDFRVEKIIKEYEAVIEGVCAE
ncbi:MAG: glycosyltransferase [Deltaproteobacteria bacterium]|nr:glycosyltransferase [Deltaproteobacteria bacterium]